MKEIIKVKDLSRYYGSKENKNVALNDINFSIEEGEFVSIMGPSGCGKSTLLYSIAGLDKPNKGSVIIDDTDIYNLNDKNLSEFRRSMIGFIFQFYNLVPNLTVEENILLPIVMAGKKVSSYKDELEDILNLVGLSEKRNHRPEELSGGQQQRVSIARAVISSPKIILADEATGNLDSKSGKTILELFKKINKEKGITILQVTHSEECAKYGERIIRLFDGKIIKDSQKIF
ncbi:ABC transporter ATP-binding protein [Clostridium isatidis]|uniref:Macrolide ABC transporter ATP-binding protein n=1 Tax=Clostridium isatidis TaxID=182773 RepID=A0A343JA06_9CLOT|nr:ABC transporter ATP-binding protein [Clostridium isatidis]ASW42364.1 macrolide ABC transporter ATP-binding protein [Clostridium isatidis]